MRIPAQLFVLFLAICQTFQVTSAERTNNRKARKDCYRKGPKNSPITQLCDYDKNYFKYSKKIDKLVRRNFTIYEKFLGNISQPIKEQKILRFVSNDVENLCDTVTYTHFPRVARDITKKRQIIVNTEIYKQQLTFQTCSRKTSCLIESPLQIETVCQPVFNTVRLLSYNRIKDDLEHREFTIPCACVCAYSKKPV